MNNFVDLIARILISAVFLISGINKINQYEGTVQWMESFGVPGILIIPAIILEVIGSILIIVGYQTRITATIFSIFCISLAFIFHSDFSNQMQMVSFFKNLALAGGFLLLVVNGPGKISLDKKLR